MYKKINFYLLEFAINALLRQKSKNFFIVTIFTLLIFLLTSVFYITNSIKYELNTTVDTLPQIVVQNLKAGRHYDIDISLVDTILTINGVEDASARVWGYYYFKPANLSFTLVGIDEFENQYKTSFSKIAQTSDFQDSNYMIIGKGVKKIMQKSYYEDYFNFIKPDGTLKKIFFKDTFDAQTELESNDVIVMSKKNIREIFDIDENLATDIVIKVANPKEIATIASKIKLLIPTARVITTKDLKVSYQTIFNYKSGIFLALFVITIFTFFIIIYDKANALSSEEKKEIGILKAIGWQIDDVLKEKFYEASILSIFSYIVGVTLALFFVYILQAPLLRDIFIGYSDLKPTFALPFIFDIQTLFLVFFLTVPVYISATIIPSWRVATLDADEVIR